MLRSRILTAVGMAAVLLTVLLLLPPVATLALLTLAVLIGAWEWSAFVRGLGRGLRIGYVALVAALLALAWEYCSERGVLRGVLLVTALWWLVALAWVALAPQRVAAWSAGLAGLLALVPAWLALAQLRLAGADGGQWTLFALVLIGAADTGAFFSGRRFGRVKLAPRVSPGKTWEGVLGGMLLALLTGLAGAAYFGAAVLPFVAVAFATAAFSVVGDLTESLLKRAAGVKDSGHLFPGHGGMLDRLDSLCAGAPLFVLGLLLAGAMP